MTERLPDSDNPPDDTAEIRQPRRRRVSPVWLIPLAALLIGGWLVYDNLASKGPTVTLDIATAAGIEAGNTKLKVRSVPVGHVTDVSLADDYSGAVVHVQMNPDTARLLGDDATFWVVKPRVGPRGISGLNTIISGAYLQMRPSGEPSDKRRFTVRDSPPPTPNNKPGVTVKLIDSKDNTLSVGDPIVFQGHNVGRIEDSRFSVGQRQTVYTVFIRQPYAKLISGATQFWLRSGIDLHLGSQGVDIQLGSLQSVLAGGITFGQPKDVKAGKPAHDGERFKLYATHNAATQDRYERKIEYVVLLNDSVRGLSAGAAVEYRGLRVGTVEKVPFYPKSFKLSSFSGFRIPVLIAIEPQRPSLGWAKGSNKKWRQRNQRFFKNGLRATIKSANLLTGAMFIDLAFDPHAEKYTAATVGKYPVFPSHPSPITNIQQQISNLMNTLNNVQPGPIIEQFKHISSATDETLEQLRKAVRGINDLLAKPGTQELPTQMNDTLKQLQKTLANFQRGTPAHQQFNQAIDRLNEVLDNAAPLTRTLRDHPNALLFGRPNGADPVPKAKQ